MEHESGHSPSLKSPAVMKILNYNRGTMKIDRITRFRIVFPKLSDNSIGGVLYMAIATPTNAGTASQRLWGFCCSWMITQSIRGPAAGTKLS